MRRLKNWLQRRRNYRIVNQNSGELAGLGLKELEGADCWVNG
ncbi:hypothetical protein [Adonisia turfae]|nr:hypothetical protein [Adonisia turfae]